MVIPVSDGAVDAEQQGVEAAEADAAGEGAVVAAAESERGRMRDEG